MSTQLPSTGLPPADIQAAFALSPQETLYVLSPHLDDAAWSLGAVLQELVAAGHPVHVITLFSQTLDVATRKAEDTAVLRQIGCALTHLDFADAIMDGRPVAEAFNEAYEPDQSTVEAIVRRVTTIVPPEATILGPSGFGVHVDHLTTRAVTASLPGRHLYYEDMPYAARTVRIDNARDFLAGLNLRRQPIITSPELLEHHIALYNAYASQRQDHHVAQIREYVGRMQFGVWV